MSRLALKPEQSRQLQTLVEDWCGILLDADRTGSWSQRLQPLLEDFDCEDYWQFIEKARAGLRGIEDAIIDAVTINETSWFRDPGVFGELRSVIIPELLARRDVEQPGINIWSAACSTGQEPYTLAMLIHEMERLAEVPGLLARNVKIQASDVSRAALAIAEKGCYDAISMNRGLPEGLGQRYFDRDGAICSAGAALRQMIQFRRLNLRSDHFGSGSMNLVLLRNVLIYFTPDQRRVILEKMHRCLRPGGVLVVGAPETADGVGHLFESVFSGRAMYYRKK